MDSTSWLGCINKASTQQTLRAAVQNCWQNGALTPMSNPLTCIAISAVYLLCVLILRHSYRAGPASFAHSRSFLLAGVIHNTFLSVGSLVMNLHATQGIISVARTTSIAHTICAPSETQLSPQLRAPMYIFLLSKVYELLDTALLLFRGRAPTTLHVWHHASVSFEVWAWIEFEAAVGIYGMWFNTAVHVVMYAYYALALLKVPFPFKRLITITQIVQFITGFCTLLPFIVLHRRYAQGCHGVPGLIISSFINGSYLVLFIDFFRKTYGPATHRRKATGGDPKMIPGSKKKS